VHGELDREEAGEGPVAEIERAGDAKRNSADVENTEVAVNGAFVAHEGHDVES